MSVLVEKVGCFTDSEGHRAVAGDEVIFNVLQQPEQSHALSTTQSTIISKIFCKNETHFCLGLSAEDFMDNFTQHKPKIKIYELQFFKNVNVKLDESILVFFLTD